MLLNEQRLRQRMSDASLDAVVATAPENVTYMSGFWALPQWIRRGPQAYVMWPVSERGTPEIITGTSTLDLVADQRLEVAKVRRFGEFHVELGPNAIEDAVGQQHLQLRELPPHQDAITALVAALEGAGLASGNIGIDESGLAIGYAAALTERLPNATITPASALLRQVRAVKTDDEICRLRQVARIAERSIAAALGVAREGSSEIGQ